MEYLANKLSATWDSMLGRVLIIGLACGWLPFWFLCRVQQLLATR